MTSYLVGQDRPFYSIESGLASCDFGDSLFIDVGTYYEVINLNNKAVNLVGVSPYLDRKALTVYNSVNTSFLYFKYDILYPETTIIIENLIFSGTNNLSSFIYFDAPEGGENQLKVVFNKCLFDASECYFSYLINNFASNCKSVSLLEFRNCTFKLNTGVNLINPNFSCCNIVINKCLSSKKCNITITSCDILPLTDISINYGHNYGSFITPLPNRYIFYGSVTVNKNVKATGSIMALSSDNSCVLAKTVTNSLGEYSLVVPTIGPYDLMCCLDNTTFYKYPVIVKNVFPKIIDI